MYHMHMYLEAALKSTTSIVALIYTGLSHGLDRLYNCLLFSKDFIRRAQKATKRLERIMAAY